MKHKFTHWLKKCQELLQSSPYLIPILVLSLLFSLVFLFSKNEDRKATIYQQQHPPDYSAGRMLSSPNSIYKKKDRVVYDKLQSLESQLKEMSQALEQARRNQDPPPKPESTPEPTPSPPPATPIDVFDSSVPSPHSLKIQPTITTSTPKPAPIGPSIINFPVAKSSKTPTLESVILPSGSYVKAKLLTGVEAAEGKALPVLMQADYAFVGPNRTRIDLSGCFLIAKSTGNLSIERVEMQATKLSCVAKSGKMFERKMRGFVADDTDNSFAVMGQVNSKQDRVAAMAFLSSIVEGIGNAVSMAQTTRTQNSDGVSQLNISGSERRYIAASGVSNAAATVTQWYLRHAENLLPTINIGSGQDVWIITQERLDLPNWYFRSAPSEASNYSYLSRILQ